MDMGLSGGKAWKSPQISGLHGLHTGNKAMDARVDGCDKHKPAEWVVTANAIKHASVNNGV